jgi:hypothetical protein
VEAKPLAGRSGHSTFDEGRSGTGAFVFDRPKKLVKVMAWRQRFRRGHRRSRNHVETDSSDPARGERHFAMPADQLLLIDRLAAMPAAKARCFGEVKETAGVGIEVAGRGAAPYAAARTRISRRRQSQAAKTAEGVAHSG